MGRLKKLEYIKDCSTGIETISYEKVNISYPKHTHIGHVVFGIVTGGTVGVKIDQEDFVCNNGEMFSIAPNVPHSKSPGVVRKWDEGGRCRYGCWILRSKSFVQSV